MNATRRNSPMSFIKVYDWGTQTVSDVEHFGPVHTDKICACMGPTIRKNKKTRLTFQCRMMASDVIDGVQYCWRHKRILQSGKSPSLFPPGPMQ